MKERGRQAFEWTLAGGYFAFGMLTVATLWMLVTEGGG